ncbi:bacterial bifunctional deaminase-reductase [Hysterangium stoloniferum]|nr:bacterial bifunctional deaminase-reductase [Hysterangium stoloniferum]
MSTGSSTEAQAPAFLSSLLPSPILPKHPRRPHVTLTYAQSLDGCIAGIGGRQLILSGKESMVMTHWMRTMHDAILVGIGTAMNDDPQLNGNTARHLPPRNVPYALPRPVILDSELRLPLHAKLLKNYQQGTGRRPWIICHDVSSADKALRQQLLEKAGAMVFTISGSNHGESLMVEGGQRVIASFLAQQDQDGIPAVDILIITVAPTLVGVAGVGVLPKDLIPKLEHLASTQFGCDTVIACSVSLS